MPPMRPGAEGSAAFSAPMPELDRKRAYYRSSNIQRSSDIDGQTTQVWMLSIACPAVRFRTRLGE